MAGSIGSARQEAERLVASVLAMAGESDDLSRTRQRLTEGIGALGDTLAGMVGQFTGESPRSRPEAATEGPGGAASAAERPATENSPGRGTGGQGAGGQGADADEEHGRHEAGDRANGGQWIGGWGWVARGLSGWTGGRASSHGPGGWSTGSAECCVCPICRAIAAVRDPSPETAVRLAAGAGDLATGVARAMRAFSTLGGTRPAQRTKPARPTRHVHDPDIAWSAATRTAGGGARHEAPVEDLDPETSDPWTAATRTAYRPASTAGRHEAPVPPPEAAQQPGPARKPAPPAPGADPWAAATAAFATPNTTTKPPARAEAGPEPVLPESRDQESAVSTPAAQGPADATAAESGPAASGGATQDATTAGAAGSRTQKDARGDADVAGTPGVAHDVPGPVDAGPAEGGSAPAPAAGDRAAGTDDEAGTREAG